MSFRNPWLIAVLTGAVVLAILIQAPQFLAMRDARSQGLLIKLNSDEEIYLARVEEVLQGRIEQASEAFVGKPELRGTQFALLEAGVGMLFRPFGLRPATVLQIMDSIVCFSLFLLLYWFFRQCGFGKAAAYGGTTVFVLIQLYNLNRPIHQGLSFSIMLLAMNLLLPGLAGRRALGFIGGVLMGILVGAYFWSWTYVWLWAAGICAWKIAEWWYERRKGNAPDSKPLRRLLLFLLVAVIVAIPFVWQTTTLLDDPLYAETALRSGMYPSRMPESIAYSVIFTVIFLCITWSLLTSYRQLRQYMPAIMTAFAAFGVMNQQILHGVVFNFVSHYLFSIILGALCTVLLWLSTRRPILLLATAAATVYLAAVAYDGRWILEQYQERQYDEVHFSTLLPVLDSLPRNTILSSSEAMAFIDGWTKHDVTYSLYLKNVLMSNQELAQRYCLSQIPTLPKTRNIASQEILIYPDEDSAFKNDSSVRQREVALVEDACRSEDADPPSFLKAYGVQYVLWDEKRNPDWDLSRLRVPLAKVASGEGWSLWKI